MKNLCFFSRTHTSCIYLGKVSRNGWVKAHYQYMEHPGHGALFDLSFGVLLKKQQPHPMQDKSETELDIMLERIQFSLIQFSIRTANHNLQSCKQREIHFKGSSLTTDFKQLSGPRQRPAYYKLI